MDFIRIPDFSVFLYFRPENRACHFLNKMGEKKIVKPTKSVPCIVEGVKNTPKEKRYGR